MIGTIAQLVERLIRIQEARGSTPLCSIIFYYAYSHTTRPPRHAPNTNRPRKRRRRRREDIIYYFKMMMESDEEENGKEVNYELREQTKVGGG